jgi:hypothetical protein
MDTLPKLNAQDLGNNLLASKKMIKTLKLPNIAEGVRTTSSFNPNKETSGTSK